MEAAYARYADAEERQTRRLLSECWIYTRERGLRAVTLHGNGATIALDGQWLYRWHIFDRSSSELAVALLYCADVPSRDLEERVTQAARERFKNEPWFADS